MNTDKQSDTQRTPRGWHSRGYLPHFDGGEGLPQSVTFRLADSVPAAVVEQWLAELKAKPQTERELELRKRIEKYLDAGYGACHLSDSRIGTLVDEAIRFFDAERYRLHAWVVMPNHVHVLFTPTAGWELSAILSSWKSFTAKEANTVLRRTGQFWMEEYFDRYIRDGRHYTNATDYIENNPVKARLCGVPEDWPFCSARYRHRTADVAAAETAAVPG